MKYSRLLADKHPDIVPQILKGVGVDVGARNPRVNMRSFFNLNCILDYGVASKEELVQFWTRVLDPSNIMLVDKAEVLNLFDKLSKGRFSKSDHEMLR